MHEDGFYTTLIQFIKITVYNPEILSEKNILYLFFYTTFTVLLGNIQSFSKLFTDDLSFLILKRFNTLFEDRKLKYHILCYVQDFCHICKIGLFYF